MMFDHNLQIVSPLRSEHENKINQNSSVNISVVQYMTGVMRKGL